MDKDHKLTQFDKGIDVHELAAALKDHGLSQQYIEVSENIHFELNHTFFLRNAKDCNMSYKYVGIICSTYIDLDIDHESLREEYHNHNHIVLYNV